MNNYCHILLFMLEINVVAKSRNQLVTRNVKIRDLKSRFNIHNKKPYLCRNYLTFFYNRYYIKLFIIVNKVINID